MNDWTPHITVATLVERDGRFLMVEEESEGRVVLNQPAGHLDAGETLIEAAIRETLEESGWHIRPTAVTGIHQWTHRDGVRTYLRVCFAADALDHEPDRPLDRDILRALWMTRDELAAETARLRSPMVLPCIDEYLSGQRFPLTLFNDHDRHDAPPAALRQLGLPG